MRHLVYAVPAETRTGLAYLPAELTEGQSYLGYSTNCFDSKHTARNASRKKRNKSKGPKKSSPKIFPEESLSNACNDEIASSFQICRENNEIEALSSIDSMKSNFVPPVSPLDNCIPLEKFSEVNISNRTKLVDSPRCEIPDIINNRSQCLISYCKPNTSMNVDLQPSECCNEELGFTQCPSLNVYSSVRARSGSCGNQDIKRAWNNIENVRRDQSRWTWKRCQKSSKSGTVSLPGQVHIDSSCQTGNSLIPQAVVDSVEISLMACSSAKLDCAASGSKTLDAVGDNLCRGEHRVVSRESFANAPEQRLQTELCHSGSLTQPITSTHSTGFEKPFTNQTDFGEIKHNKLRGRQHHWSKLNRHQHDSVPSQTELLQPHIARESKHSDNQDTVDAIQQCERMKLSRVKLTEAKKQRHSLNENWRNDNNFSIASRTKRGQDAPQNLNLRKWIPVLNKNVKIPKSTGSDIVSGSTSDYPLMEKNGSILQGDVIPLSVPDAPSDPQHTKLLSTPEMTCVVEAMEQAPEIQSSKSLDKYQMVQVIKDYCQPFPMPEGFPHLLISAEVVEQAFISSYRLQVASESAQWAAGYPLAEFEKVLCSASPHIASTVSPQSCNGWFNNQLYSPLIYRQQTEQIPLQSVWDWYEEPGNYGLKVNVNDPQIHKGFVAETVQFHAYFVPLLSAIQLFGYQHTCSSSGNVRESNLEGACYSEARKNFHHFKYPVSYLEASVTGKTLANMKVLPATSHLSDIHGDDGIKPSIPSAPSLHSNAELIFEYFESELPQRRMPLRNKVTELASGQTSNTQLFGDPSKLKCTNLNELHPASWFSVAWYPIYRIPEGKLHAAFLTYHSLGQFFQRPIATDNFDKGPKHLILPVMGLESYNPQGELWFSSNIEVESSLGELTSSVLKERCRILEENALLFARGIVSRDDKMVANQQPDYEFFKSRKQGVRSF